MEETVIVVMVKDEKTGFFERELLTFQLAEHENLLVNIDAREVPGGLRLCMKVTTGVDVADWQFDAIYDYYDTGIFAQMGAEVSEMDDCYNPIWTLVFDCPENLDDAGQLVAELLHIHHAELAAVYEAIKEQEEAYQS
jgi:hypothetical protein